MDRSQLRQREEETGGTVGTKTHQARASQKRALLDEAVTQTGYTREYAGWLLNHPEQMQSVTPSTA